VKLSEDVIARTTAGAKVTSATNRKEKRRRMRKYRKIAQDCFDLALLVKDEDDRRALLDLASKWLEMAGDDPKTLKLVAEAERLKGITMRA
jgi:hypothetical protein